MALAPINPADLLTVAGRYAPVREAGTCVGAEGTGRVQEVGAGVSAVAPGDRVMLLSRGNWIGWRIVPIAEVLRVPDSLPDAQAATLRINPATAWRLLDWLALKPGDWLAQNAAGSSVARWVRLIAVRRGLNVLDVVRSPMADGGAIVDGDELEARAATASGGAPIRGALDAVAGEATGRLAACLAVSGRLAVFGHLSGQPCSISSTVLTTRMLTLGGFSLRPAEQADSRDRLEALYSELAALMTKAPEPVAAVYPLSALHDALGAAAASGRRGRVLLALDR